jgi:uncharacterized OsmC-like protein
MTTTFNLRERQAPLKERFTADPASAQTTITVRSTTPDSPDPRRVRIQSTGANGAVWDAGAHELAGGDGDLACSGDILLASLAACQEVTLRMVASAMGIELTRLDLTVEGDMDFRGTMAIDKETPVGFTDIRITVEIEADATTDRLERLVKNAERYCVVSATLKNPPVVTMTTRVNGA